jgi:hypothetical protein
MRAERFFVAVATTVFVLYGMPASAQDRKAIMHACAGDVERLCAGVTPGNGRIKMCMKSKIAKVSAPCINSVLRAIAAGKEP